MYSILQLPYFRCVQWSLFHQTKIFVYICMRGRENRYNALHISADGSMGCVARMMRLEKHGWAMSQMSGLCDWKLVGQRWGDGVMCVGMIDVGWADESMSSRCWMWWNIRMPICNVCPGVMDRGRIHWIVCMNKQRVTNVLLHAQCLKKRFATVDSSGL